ncbi:MAG TPA: hypothetical protein VHP11_13335 [Tepidisphaeraceae bacterium]|nr:hypothetical protein [Tepidisphaeraceae bacterium]
MTLIVASIRPQDVALTADGRSTTSTNGVVTGVDDAFQKLFPIPDHPVVIGHMGENRLANQPLRDFLHHFVQHLNTGNLTILEIADELCHYAHAAIRTRLKSLGNPKFGCNLWVAGFGLHEKQPKLVETFWRFKDDALMIEERQHGPLSVVLGGDGKQQISLPDWHAVEGKSVEEVRAYHLSLMNQAMQAKVEPNTVGGHIHEIVITPAECRWTQPPKAQVS